MTRCHPIAEWIREPLASGESAISVTDITEAVQGTPRSPARPAVDAEIVAAFRAGDHAAADTIIRVTQHRITRLVRRLLAWQADVHDVVGPFTVYL